MIILMQSIIVQVKPDGRTTRWTCNHEIISTYNALQRVHHATFEIYLMYFVVACPPGSCLRLIE